MGARNGLLSFLSFVRLPNLAIVALSMLLPYYQIYFHKITAGGFAPQLSQNQLIILVSCTVLVTLAGYIINDFADREIDFINRPTRQFIGRFISPTNALILYFSLLGLLHGMVFFLFKKPIFPDFPWQYYLFTGVSILLFTYALFFKCMPLIGNIIVAVLCGVVPMVLLLGEWRTLQLMQVQSPEIWLQITSLYGQLVVFATCITFLRELIKDMEDRAGDGAVGCKTAAVLFGPRFMRVLIIGVGFACLGLLLFWWKKFIYPTGNDFKIYFSLLFVLLPLFTSLIYIYLQNTIRSYKIASGLLKIAMLCGLLTIIF